MRMASISGRAPETGGGWQRGVVEQLAAGVDPARLLRAGQLGEQALALAQRMAAEHAAGPAATGPAAVGVRGR